MDSTRVKLPSDHKATIRLAVVMGDPSAVGMYFLSYSYDEIWYTLEENDIQVDQSNMFWATIVTRILQPILAIYTNE